MDLKVKRLREAAENGERLSAVMRDFVDKDRELTDFEIMSWLQFAFGASIKDAIRTARILLRSSSLDWPNDEADRALNVHADKWKESRL